MLPPPLAPNLSASANVDLILTPIFLSSGCVRLKRSHHHQRACVDGFRSQGPVSAWTLVRCFAECSSTTGENNFVYVHIWMYACFVVW